MNRHKIRTSLIGLGVALGLNGVVQASAIHVESLTNGVATATATFTFDDNGGGGGGTLSVTVVNTSLNRTAQHPHTWLNGVFWNLKGLDVTNVITPVASNAVTAPDGMVTNAGDASEAAYAGLDASANPVGPGHFWGYRDDISGGDYGAFLNTAFGGTARQYGVGSAGFGVFGNADIIAFQTGGPTPQPDGPDGALLAQFVPATDLDLPNGAAFNTPMVINSLVFLFDISGSFDESLTGINDIAFVFGTNFGETVLIPLPMALPMGLAGLAGVVVMRRRATRAKQPA